MDLSTQMTSGVTLLVISIQFILVSFRQALHMSWQDGLHMVYSQKPLLKKIHFPYTVVTKKF